ncbi:MAG: hypothetical protein V4507_10030 [Verrucomicrobiota bacterium]
MLVLTISAAFIALNGCASSQDPNNTDPNHVSNIPWNKPQSWEGGGMLGGALGGGGN